MLAMVVLTTLVLGGAVVLMATFDANAYKGRIEAAVRQATGRDFTITGNIAVVSFTGGTLTADGLVLANVAGGTRPDMLTIGRVEADVALLPLLSGRVELDRLVLQGPDLLLERGADGSDNWHFSRGAAPAGPAEAPATPDRPQARAAPLLIRALHIRDGRLRFLDQTNGRTVAVEVRRLAATEAAAGDRLLLSAEIVAQGHAVQLSGQSGTLAQLLGPQPSAPFALTLTAQTAGTRLTAAGSFADPLKATGYSFRLDASAADTSGLMAALGLPPVPLRNLSLGAQITDGGTGVADVTAMTLRIGASDLGSLVSGLKLEAVELSAPALDQPMRAELRGTLAGSELHATADLGAARLLLPRPAAAAAPPFPVDLRLGLGQSVLSAKGSVADPARLAGVDLAVLADVADLQAFAPLAGTRLPALRQLHVEARLNDAPGGLKSGLTLSRLVLKLPQADLQGEVAVLSGQPNAVRLHLTGQRVELDPLLDAFDGVQVATATRPTSEAPPVGTPQPPRRQLLLSENRLGLRALERLDVDARLELGELVVHDVAYRDVRAEIQLKDGRLAVEPFSGQLPGGKVEMALHASSKGAASPVALRLTGPAMALKPLLTALRRPEDISGVLDASIDLRGVGDTPHDIAATLNGTIGLALENGEIDNALLLPLINGLRRLLPPVPFVDGPGRTKLRCVAVRMDFTDGVGSSPGWVLDTPRLLVQGAGQVNLADETLALRLRPLLRAGAMGVVVPLRVDGTLLAPKVALDPQAAAAAAGEAALAGQAEKGGLLGKLGAAMTGMAQAERSGDACISALALARGRAGAAPLPPATEARPPANAPADILRRLLR